MKVLTRLLALSCLLSTYTFGQVGAVAKSELRDQSTGELIHAFATRLDLMVDRVRPACVLITTQERLTPTGGVSASGVCVNQQGIIMTAGHLVIPGGSYKIVFPDGTKVDATGLGKIASIDLGLLKIVQAGKYPFAPVGWSGSTRIGDACFSMSYPGSFTNKLVVKIGEILALNQGGEGNIRTRHLQTSCLMEPGDSGGPVFNLNGQVIGIRSYIGLDLDENYDSPTDLFRRYWQALLKPVLYQFYPDMEPLPADTTHSYFNYNWADLVRSADVIIAKQRGAAVRITSRLGADHLTAGGTLVDKEVFAQGKAAGRTKVPDGGYIISKSSLVGTHPKLQIDGKSIGISVCMRDQDKDLILLKLDTTVGSGLSRKDLEVSRNSSAMPGNLLITPLDGVRRILGTTGSRCFDIPLPNQKGYLGVGVRTEDNRLVVSSVQKGTVADKAGLKAGDILKRIDTLSLTDTRTFINFLKGKKPQDSIWLVRVQEQKTDTLCLVLGRQPIRETGHPAEKFLDGKSERRTGLKNVFITDGWVKPGECGSPVFNVNGQFIGIQMARYSRTINLVAPAENVLSFLASFQP